MSTWLETLLDRSIVLSFDHSGFERHRKRFEPSDLEVDLTGRRCLVSGANSGIGKAVATGLARRGATVWLLCRSSRRGARAEADIRAATNSRNVHAVEVDLSEGASIAGLLEALPHQRIDLLVNNAAVLPAGRAETSEGFETTVATNLLGPLRLTTGLLDRLERSPDARVVNVSSGGMYATRLQLDDPNWRQRAFDGVRAYAETKRALVVLNELWAQQGAARGITFHSMHPGWVDTEGVRRSLPRFWRTLRRRLRTVDQGADTILWLATTAPEKLGSGRFWFDRRPVSTHLVPWTRESRDDRSRFWEICRSVLEWDADRRAA